MESHLLWFAGSMLIKTAHARKEKMRTAYGQLICLLQDSTREEVAEEMGLSLVKPVVTVASYLEYYNALHLLHDEKMYKESLLLTSPKLTATINEWAGVAVRCIALQADCYGRSDLRRQIACRDRRSS